MASVCARIRMEPLYVALNAEVQEKRAKEITEERKLSEQHEERQADSHLAIASAVPPVATVGAQCSITTAVHGLVKPTEAILTEVQLFKVQEELPDFSEWYKLGGNLGLSPAKLNVIKANHQSEGVYECLGQVLLEWLKRNHSEADYGPPTWSSLARALKPINSALAMNIQDRHCSQAREATDPAVPTGGAISTTTSTTTVPHGSQLVSNTAVTQSQFSDPNKRNISTVSNYDAHHQEPQLKDLMEWISPQAAAQWKIIGIFLEIPARVLEDIEYGHPSAHDALLAVFTTWKKIKCSFCSWKAILSVLATDMVGHRRLADDIAQKLSVGCSTETMAQLPEILSNLTEGTTEMDGSGMLQQQSLSPPSDNKERHEVPLRVKRLFTVIRTRFGRVFIKVIKDIEAIDLKDLKSYLYVALEEHRDELENIQSMDGIRAFLERNTSFTDYTLLEEIADSFELEDVQKELTKSTEARNVFYKQILAEDFAAAAVDQYKRNTETEIVFVVRWAKNKATLLVFQEMLSHAFENSGRHIKLIAVHKSLLTFICVCQSWTVGSLIRVARSNVTTLRQVGVLKLTIGRVTIFNDVTPEVKEEVVYTPEPKTTSVPNEDVLQSPEVTAVVRVFNKFLFRLAAHMQSPNLLVVLAKDLLTEGLISEDVVSEINERVQRVSTDTTGQNLTGTAHLILRAVEIKIAGDNGREALKVFCHVIMRDQSLKLFGEPLLTKAESYSPCVITSDPRLKVLGEKLLTEAKLYPSVSECVKLFVEYEDRISKLIPYPSLIAQDLCEYGLFEKTQSFKLSSQSTEHKEQVQQLLDTVRQRISIEGWESLRVFLQMMIRDHVLRPLAEELILSSPLPEVVPMASHDDHVIPTPPVDLVFDDFIEHKQSAKPWFSPPFYSHPHGYRLCIKADANGCLQGKGSHLSVFAYLTPGKNDDNLYWPFRASVSWQLHDRFGKQHVNSTATFDGHNKAICDRVIFGERAAFGLGDPTFFPHSELMKDDTFLDNNRVTFRIPSVVTYSSQYSSKVPSWYDSTTASKFIIEFVLTDFTKHKHNADNYFSPPFLTHYHGYNMHVRIDPDGDYSGRGTHLSVYAYLMKGEYDNELIWPFQGQITVQILNWKNNHSHVKHTIDFSETPGYKSIERVLEGGYSSHSLNKAQFIAHTSLFSPPPDTQYVQDDCIRFRVVSVNFPID